MPGVQIAAYVTGETFKELVLDCERLTSNPGLFKDPGTGDHPASGMMRNAPGYRWLLDILRSLYLEWDWPFAIRAANLMEAPGTGKCLYLPGDFWRVAFANSLYGLLPSANLRFQLQQITRPQFFNNVTLGYQTPPPGKPTSFYISRPDNLVYVDPPWDQHYTFELHYFHSAIIPTDPNESVTFPYKDYLRQCLLVRYYEDQNDGRLQDAYLMKKEMWGEIRQSAYDTREEPHRMPQGLDEQFFRDVDYGDDSSPAAWNPLLNR